MGTAPFSVGTYAKSGSRVIMASTLITSGAYTTSTSASNLEDAGGDITVGIGQVIQIYADEAMRIRFGGTATVAAAATATVGHYIPAGEQREFEVAESGFVSIIDVA